MRGVPDAKIMQINKIGNFCSENIKYIFLFTYTAVPIQKTGAVYDIKKKPMAEISRREVFDGEFGNKIVQTR